MLTAIKLLHTAIWAVMAGAILAVPYLAIRRRLRWAAILSALVWVECVVLALNRGRCPLTDWAGAFTTDRAANFDIYLPLWLAANNKTVFGSLFVAGEIVFLCCWLKKGSGHSGVDCDEGSGAGVVVTPSSNVR